jgi:hypothetical protein
MSRRHRERFSIRRKCHTVRFPRGLVRFEGTPHFASSDVPHHRARILERSSKKATIRTVGETIHDAARRTIHKAARRQEALGR